MKGNNRNIIAYISGSSIGSGTESNKGGFAVIYLFKDKNGDIVNEAVKITGGLDLVNNNIMGFEALIQSLLGIPPECREDINLNIYTDSAYILNCMTNANRGSALESKWLNPANVYKSNKEQWYKAVDLLKQFLNVSVRSSKVEGIAKYRVLASNLAKEASKNPTGSIRKARIDINDM